MGKLLNFVYAHQLIANWITLRDMYSFESFLYDVANLMHFMFDQKLTELHTNDGTTTRFIDFIYVKRIYMRVIERKNLFEIKFIVLV